MAGDEDDRNPDASPGQAILQIEAALAGQTDIEDKTTRPLRQLGGQEILHRAEGQNAHFDGAQQAFERLADRGVVVDDDDGRLLNHRAIPLAPRES